jgi:hypothetical protein
MAAASTAAIGARQGLLPGILMGSAIAGALDLTFACLNTRLQTGYGLSVVFKAIASGLVGTHAFFRSAGIAFLGLVLHLYIAFVWAAFFAVAATRWTVLIHHAALSGALYGVLVYIGMYGGFLPLSSYPKSLWRHGISFGQISLDLIGLPMALSVRYCARRATHA